MNARLLSDVSGLRTFAPVFQSGDEVAAGLLAFAQEQETSSAAFTGIGALRHAHLVVGRADGTAHGGHLLEAHVRPTLRDHPHRNTGAPPA